MILFFLAYLLVNLPFTNCYRLMYSSELKYSKNFRLQLFDFFKSNSISKKVSDEKMNTLLDEKKKNLEKISYTQNRDWAKEEANIKAKPVEIKEGIYTCKKCGGKKTQSYEVQLRRSDEPATVFIECVNPKCRNKWSIN